MIFTFVLLKNIVELTISKIWNAQLGFKKDWNVLCVFNFKSVFKGMPFELTGKHLLLYETFSHVIFFPITFMIGSIQDRIFFAVSIIL